MQDVKDFALLGLALIGTLISWIFRASQKSQDERITALEVRQVRFEDRLISATRDINEQFDKHRSERRNDLEAMNLRNDKAHEAIVTRLDTLISNGKHK
jgi:hypothetical protein